MGNFFNDETPWYHDMLLVMQDLTLTVIRWIRAGYLLCDDKRHGVMIS